MKKFLSKRLYLLLLLIPLFSTPVCAQTPDTGWYTISTKQTPLYRVAAKDSLTLQRAGNNSDQKFKLTKISGNTYKIGTGYSAGILSLKSGNKIQAYDGDKSMQWIIEEDGSFYRVKNAKSGKYLTYSSLTEKLSEKAKKDDNTQKFKIAKENVSYTVTFKNDGQTISRQSIKSGQSAKEPDAPQKSGCTFDGWDKSFNKITANTTVNAKWVKTKTYTVTFRTKAKVLKTQTVEHGKAATAPELPSGYTLVSWNKDFSNITQDTTVTANFWWKNKYYENGELVKGLQKINGKWYILDKTTGEKLQEGDNILLGTWHDYEAGEYTRFFVSLDGHNFIYNKSFGSVRGRHMSFYTEDGIFYGLKIFTRNPVRGAANPVDFYSDFAIRATVNFTDNIYKHDKILNPLVPNEKWQWHFIKGAFVDGKSLGYDSNKYSVGRSGPEWFIEGNKKYVFYVVDTILDDTLTGGIGKRNYVIYRTQINKLNKNDTSKTYIIENATTPVQMKFDKYPPHAANASKTGVFYPYVTKEGSTYIMFVKDETDGPIVRNGSIWVYTSTDLTNWKFKYTVSTDALPHTATTRTNPVTGKVDLNKDGNPAMFERYYQAPCAIKIGDTWHLYVEEQTYRLPKIDTGVEDDKYSGKIVHLTSKNILKNDWKNEGYVNAGNNRVRGASVLVMNDAKAEKTVQTLFNK